MKITEAERHETEGRKYGGGVVHILPLASGRLALLSNRRQIVDAFGTDELEELVCAILATSLAGRREYERRMAAPAPLNIDISALTFPEE